LIVAVYNFENNRVENVFPHIFANYDSGKWVHPFIGNLQLVTDEKPAVANYWHNTHIIQCVYQKFSVYYFASFANQEKVFYAVVRGKKKDIESLNFHYEHGDGKIQSGVAHLANPFEDLPLKFNGDLITGSYHYSGDGKKYCGQKFITGY
jgi:hypothetical protein